ncbi:MAG: hypothetical protein JNM36_13950 [Chitinophagales bacterium]|jgi:hypothetical protein|nr:hypothetical protein [Chitinophagales bacterium]
MKKTILLFVATFVAYFTFSANLFAQETNDAARIARSTIYIEAGGPGLITSFNYDFRFKKANDGLGMRLGIGGFMLDGDGVLTVPVQLNYLSGKHNNYFEIGAGISYCSSSGTLFMTDSGSNNSVIGSLTFGYRYQPKKGGVNFRAGLSPIFGNNDDGGFFIPYLPYLSLGYTFPGKNH